MKQFRNGCRLELLTHPTKLILKRIRRTISGTHLNPRKSSETFPPTISGHICDQKCTASSCQGYFTLSILRSEWRNKDVSGPLRSIIILRSGTRIFTHMSSSYVSVTFIAMESIVPRLVSIPRRRVDVLSIVDIR